MEGAGHLSSRIRIDRGRPRVSGRLGGVALLAVLLLGNLTVPYQHAVGATEQNGTPEGWAKSCGSRALGLDKVTVALAPSLSRDPDTNPDGSPVRISPDSRGRHVPVIMVHGWISKDTHTNERDGTFSHLIDLTANRLGQARTTRSLIGQLQRVPGTAVFTYDYRFLTIADAVLRRPPK